MVNEVSHVSGPGKHTDEFVVFLLLFFFLTSVLVTDG